VGRLDVGKELFGAFLGGRQRGRFGFVFRLVAKVRLPGLFQRGLERGGLVLHHGQQVFVDLIAALDAYGLDLPHPLLGPFVVAKQIGRRLLTRT
jgi:hypothetical protein